jgi:hypothetical protein
MKPHPSFDTSVRKLSITFPELADAIIGFFTYYTFLTCYFATEIGFGG